MSEEFIQINSDNFIPVKATPTKVMPLMKKRVQERVDQLNAKQRHKEKPPKHDNMVDYLRDKIQARNKVPGGGVVMGKLSEAEQQALTSGNEALLRKQAILREKAMRIMREKRLEGRSQRDYFQGYRGYEQLSKHQGRLPSTPRDIKDRNDFLQGE